MNHYVMWILKEINDKLLGNVIPAVHLGLEALLQQFYVTASHFRRSYIILTLRLSINFAGASLTVDDRV